MFDDDWIAPIEYSQMSTYVPEFQSFFSVFFAPFSIGQISQQQHQGYRHTSLFEAPLVASGGTKIILYFIVVSNKTFP